MKARAKELLLELGLIRLRFSSAEFKELNQLLREADPEVHSVLQFIYKAEAAPQKARQGDLPVAVDVRAERKELVAGLRSGRKYKEINRLRAIANRLNVSVVEGARAELVSEIERRLYEMADDELRSFFVRLKPRQGPDEGYLGLAGFILNRKRD